MQPPPARPILKAQRPSGSTTSPRPSSSPSHSPLSSDNPFKSPSSTTTTTPTSKISTPINAIKFSLGSDVTGRKRSSAGGIVKPETSQGQSYRTPPSTKSPPSLENTTSSEGQPITITMMENNSHTRRSSSSRNSRNARRSPRTTPKIDTDDDVAKIGWTPPAFSSSSLDGDFFTLRYKQQLQALNQIDAALGSLREDNNNNPTESQSTLDSQSTFTLLSSSLVHLDRMKQLERLAELAETRVAFLETAAASYELLARVEFAAAFPDSPTPDALHAHLEELRGELNAARRDLGDEPIEPSRLLSPEAEKITSLAERRDAARAKLVVVLKRLNEFVFDMRDEELARGEDATTPRRVVPKRAEIVESLENFNRRILSLVSSINLNLGNTLDRDALRRVVESASIANSPIKEHEEKEQKPQHELRMMFHLATRKISALETLNRSLSSTYREMAERLLSAPIPNDEECATVISTTTAMCSLEATKAATASIFRIAFLSELSNVLDERELYLERELHARREAIKLEVKALEEVKKRHRAAELALFETTAKLKRMELDDTLLDSDASSFEEKLASLREEERACSSERSRLMRRIRLLCEASGKEEVSCDFPEVFYIDEVRWRTTVSSSSSNQAWNVIKRGLERARIPILDPGDIVFSSGEIEASRAVEIANQLLPPHHPTIRGCAMRREVLNDDSGSTQTIWIPKVTKSFSLAEIGDGRLRRTLFVSRKVNDRAKYLVQGEGVLAPNNETGRVSVVFPLMRGGNLIQHLRSSSPPVATRLRYLREVGEALVALHEIGVIHRDVKPDNILLDFSTSSSSSTRFTAHLADLELAKDTTASATMYGTLRGGGGGGGLIGTLGYMAPEVRGGQAPPSAASDVYSFACTVVATLGYDAELDRLPKDTVTGALVDFGKAYEGCVATVLRPALNDVIIARALSATPEARPTMSELVAALSRRSCTLNIHCGADCHEDEGITCPRELHFFCRRDFEEYVRRTCDEAGEDELSLSCPGCDTLPGVVSGARFTDEFLVNHLPYRVFEGLVAARLRRANAKLCREKDMERETATRETERRVAAAALRDLRVKMARDHIVNEIMTDKCPSCSRAWMHVDGCRGMTCDACHTRFCGFCLQTGFSSSVELHRHVATCRLHPDRIQGVYCDDATYSRFQRERKLREIKTYVERVGDDGEMRGWLREDRTIAGILRELGGVDLNLI